MAPLNIYKLRISILLLLTTSVLAADDNIIYDTILSCPTIIKTTTSSKCPPTTPSVCVQPFCIIESRIPISCGCPTTLPISITTTTCPTKCPAGCGTYWTPLMAPSCSSTPTSFTLPMYTPPITTTTFSTITTQPTSCSTITVSEGPECWDATCETTYSRCQKTKTVTLKCGCKSIPTVVSCKKRCDGGCATNWLTGYLPCPMSLTTPSSEPTSVS